MYTFDVYIVIERRSSIENFKQGCGSRRLFRRHDRPKGDNRSLSICMSYINRYEIIYIYINKYYIYIYIGRYIHIIYIYIYYIYYIYTYVHACDVRLAGCVALFSTLSLSLFFFFFFFGLSLSLSLSLSSMDAGDVIFARFARFVLLLFLSLVVRTAELDGGCMRLSRDHM